MNTMRVTSCEPGEIKNKQPAEAGLASKWERMGINAWMVSVMVAVGEKKKF